MPKFVESMGDILLTTPLGFRVESLTLTQFLDVLTALDGAHRAGWIHRDVRPSNIVGREGGHAMLIDWGCAARKGENVEFAGGLHYASDRALKAFEAREQYVARRVDDLMSLVRMAVLYSPRLDKETTLQICRRLQETRDPKEIRAVWDAFRESQPVLVVMEECAALSAEQEDSVILRRVFEKLLCRVERG